jgi:Stigma-specific protein, Stig1
MAIGFTAELSHYPSAGRYATRATIPAPAAYDSPALAASAPTITEEYFLERLIEPPGCPLKGPPFIPHTWRCWEDLVTAEECCQGPTGMKICCPIPCPTRCGGICVDTSTDSNNCGRCGNQCPNGEVCCNGSCVTAISGGYCWSTGYGCQFGMAECTPGVCQDVQSDPLNCGACGVQCDAETQVCCAGECADLSTDANNCGACGTACPAGAICVEESCICSAPPYLATNSNYFLSNNCYPVGISASQEPGENGGLQVSFVVADSMTLPTAYSCQSFTLENSNCPITACQNPINIAGVGTDCCPVSSGFTVQLNAYPAPTADVGLMQFVILYGGAAGNEVVPQVQYWAAWDEAVCLGYGCTGQTWDSPPLGSVASTLDQGTELNIQLNTDSSGNVVSADFWMLTWVEVAGLPFPLIGPTVSLEIPQTAEIFGETAVTQVPIVAFQVDVVGPAGCSYAEFTTGSAVLNYTASQGELCVGELPYCTQETGTAETSNLTYSTVWPCCGSAISGQGVSP